MKNSNEKTSYASLTRQTGFLIIGRSYASLCLFATFAILSNILTEQMYGNYRQIWLVYNTVAPVFLFGIPATVAYFVPRFTLEEQKRFVTQTGLLLVGLGLALAMFLFFFANLMSSLFSNPPIGNLLRIFSLFPLFYFPLAMVDSLMVCIGRAKMAATFAILIASVQSATIIGTVLVEKAIEPVFIVLNCGICLVTVSVWMHIKRHFDINRISFDQRILKEQFEYGASLGLGASIGILSNAMDKWIISSYFTSSQFAIYANGSFQLPFVGVITGSVMTVLTPALVRAYAGRRKEEMLEMWHDAAYRVAVIFFPLFIYLLIFAPDLIVIIFSEKYAKSSQIFRILVVLLPLRIVVYGSLLRAIGKTKYIFFGAAQMLLINITLSLILLHSIGFIGPCIGHLLSSCYLMWYYCAVICKHMNWHPKDFFPWRRLVSLFVIASISGLSVASLKLFLSAGGFLSVSEILMSSVIFLTIYTFLLSVKHPDAVIHMIKFLRSSSK